MCSVIADIFTATPGVVRLYEGQNATLVWEYSRQLGSMDRSSFYYEGYGSGGGGDFILRKVGDNPAIPADEYRDRITYIGFGQNTGFILQDITEGDVIGGRYSIEIRSSESGVPIGNNDDAVISIYRK